MLPRLASLREVAVERCHGAVALPSLWSGLAGCSRLTALTLTGSTGGGGLPLPPPESAGGFVAPLPSCRCLDGALPGQVPGHSPACSQAVSSVPPTVALLQHLRCLDLSGNGLAGLPDALAYCQQLTALRLAGNRLQGVPAGLAALGGLRSLDLSANQVRGWSAARWRVGFTVGAKRALAGHRQRATRRRLSRLGSPLTRHALPPLPAPRPQLGSLPAGPYLQQLEELGLGANLTLHPAALPLQLVQRRSLRRLALPLWWQLAGDGGAAALLLALSPWLLLEHC